MPHDKPWLDEDPIVKHKREIDMQNEHDRLLMGAINAMMEARLANDCLRNDCEKCKDPLCVTAVENYYKILDEEQRKEFDYYSSVDFEKTRKPLTPEELIEKVKKDRIEMGLSDKKAKNKNKSPETKGLF